MATLAKLYHQDSGRVVATTISACAKGATTLTPGSKTGIMVGQYLKIQGDVTDPTELPEVVRVLTIGASTFTCTPTQYAHDAGETLIGDIDALTLAGILGADNSVAGTDSASGNANSTLDDERATVSDSYSGVTGGTYTRVQVVRVDVENNTGGGF